MVELYNYQRDPRKHHINVNISVYLACMFNTTDMRAYMM
jgi:hypothetical protein